MQIKCNWYCMGTIVLTVIRNSYKYLLPEAASRAITRIKLSKPTTNLQGNSQKGPITSIKLNKKSYRSKALPRVFTYRVERCKKQLPQRK